MEELATQLMQLAALWMGVPEKELPSIEIREQRFMPCSRCTGGYFYQTAENNWSKIVLSDTVDLTTKMGRGILFHELVHHLQSWSGPIDMIENEGEWNYREWYAYRLQRNYLFYGGAE